jgi:hypothetical protein
MAFRDEEAALRARIDVLERELASLHDVAQERDRLKAQVESLEAQLGYDTARKQRLAEEKATARRQAMRERTKAARSALKAPALRIGAIVVAVAAGIYFVGTRSCGPSEDAAPTLGMVDLDATPAPALPPLSVSGTTGTPVGCVGYVPDAPQLVLRSSSPISLRIAPHAVSGDLVLMIVGPDGEVRCDDDGGGSLNPLISTVLPPGDTRVWVGTYRSGETIEFSLAITARPATVMPDESGLAVTATPTAGVLSGPDATQTFTGFVQPITPASQVEGSCRGYLPIEPQLTLRLSRPAAVRLDATAPVDLVMLVREADGTVKCDDDSGHGADPQISGLFPEGEHHVWIGTYAETSSSVGFRLDATALAVDRGTRVPSHRVTAEDLSIEGASRGEIAASAIGARCGNGLIGVEPHVALQLDEPRDVVLDLVSASAPYAIVEHPDRTFECITTARSRHIWPLGVHHVYVGVAEESTPGPFTLTVRAEPSSLQPWTPR